MKTMDMPFQFLESLIAKIIRDNVDFATDLSIEGLIAISVDHKTFHAIKLHQNFNVDSTDDNDNENSFFEQTQTSSSLQTSSQASPLTFSSTQQTKPAATHDQNSLSESQEQTRPFSDSINSTMVVWPEAPPPDKIPEDEVMSEPSSHLDQNGCQSDKQSEYTDNAASPGNSHSSTSPLSTSIESLATAAVLASSTNLGSVSTNLFNPLSNPLTRDLYLQSLLAAGRFSSLGSLDLSTSEDLFQRFTDNSSFNDSSPKSDIMKRLHSCNQCGQTYRQPSALQRHMVAHTNVTPFPCSVCSKAFRTSGNLRVHMRTHTGERPFICPQCSKSFTYSHFLRDHMQTHIHGPKPYECDVCPRRFGLLQAMRAHKQRVHGVGTQQIVPGAPKRGRPPKKEM